ncbi:MAG: hypothetical protein JWN10_679 [Solirubrobacterales bacterium]|nr:hypothetical protein [Solirubrobacterales bacterium]
MLKPSLAVSSQPNRFTRLRWITPRPKANSRVETGVDRPAKAVTRPWARLKGFAAGAGGALTVLAAVSWPLVFSSSTFNNDWLNHLWYMWHQSLAIREDHAPSLFLDYSGGILYPIYAFYGGTLYALVGTLSLVLGDDPLRAYVLSYLLGFAAAYGGWYWIARMFGVRGWQAHIPGLVFITSASYLTMIYALGDWPEFLAVSMMPLMIAAGLSVLRASRLRFGPAIALAGSAVVFFGSHLLTMIWGSTILVVVVVALLVGAPSVRRGVTRAGVLRVAALVIPAAMVSAWFLLPTVAYEAHTLIAHAYPHARALLRELMYTVAVRNLFTFSRAPASGTIVSLAFPILAVAWVSLSIAMLAWRRQGGAWMRVLLITATATVGLTVVMTHASLILALPRAYATLQFSFRLESFVLLGLSGAMVVVLVIAQDGDARLRRWTWLLAPIAIVAVAGAAQQTSAHPQGRDRSTALSLLMPPPERFGQFDYVDNRLREYDEPLPEVYFPLSTLTSGGAAGVVLVPPHRLVATNIRDGPDLVNVKGATIVGVDAQLDDVLELPQASVSDGASPSRAAPLSATISVAPAEPLPVVAGRAISLIALAILAVELGLLAIRGISGYSSRQGPRE